MSKNLTKMPVGKLNRKASNETLDSTLDSRISSSDIPKMELLKINYVHQCKEALMPRSTQQLPLPPRLNQRFSAPAMTYKKPPMPEPTQTGHVTKVMVGAKKPMVAVSPPPTVESWNLMQNADHSNTPKFVVQSPLEDSDENEQSDTISCCNSNCSSSTCTELDTCTSVDCQVSNSWDYRKNAATRDLRRELARSGIKSRADRIAIIERTECDHVHADRDVVSRINQLFTSSAALPRNPLSIPPQPLRLAPQPFKEPNMRRRPYSVTPTTAENCCCPSAEVKQRTNSLDNRKRASGPVETKLSRIPKPITGDHLNRDKNEQLQQRIRKMFEQGSAQNRKYTPQTDITAMLKAGKSLEALIDEKQDKKQSEFDHKLLRNACQSYGVDHHKAKVERIHIRKKRQPLLIINQLNGADDVDESKRKVAALDCQYKSCQYSDKAEDQLKRLSLESGSDSGVSSAADRSEQIKENNLKNLEKCSDCVNILESQHSAYISEHSLDYAISEEEEQKIKEIEEAVGLPIKIHVRKSQNDPNDVQNFANKSLTKITTDELMNTAAKKTTQFKLNNNDMKNIEENKQNKKLQTTTIHIDEDWVQEPAEALNEFAARKPINCSDNSVKIFVSANSNDTHSRSSCASALSYASQTSGCSSAASTISSASTTSTNRSSLCEYQPVRPPKSQHTTPPQIPPRRRTKDLRLAATPTSVDGIFWNNSYFSTVEEELNMLSDADEDQCCCSISSCEDDNCSFYETSCSSIADSMQTPPPQLRNKSSYMQTAQHDRLLGDRYTQPLDLKQKQQQQQQHSMLHNDSIEDILIRNHKLLRKTDVIHELRPRSMDAAIDSGVSLNGDAGSSPDSAAEHMQNQQDSEARRLKRGHVLTELLETERIYVHELKTILKGYYDQMQNEELMHLVPPTLIGKEDILFGNLLEIFTFHSEVFLQDLENCISTTELVALCFVQRRDTFYRLYSFYCQNIPRSERLRETLVDTHLFLQECQKRLGHKLPLAAYLLKPVQRITKYQLLLENLLDNSDSGSCTKELQKALDCMLIVLKCVNDSMHQKAITGFPHDLAQQGDLLLQDSFQLWSDSKRDIRLRLKPQQRHVFLYQKSMLFCKHSKSGHNKNTYQFKHALKMSQIGLTESVRGDTKRFEVWLQGRQEVYTLQAATIEIKNKWVAEIKRVLLNQLEELKGEKIKQYGHLTRGLKQTTSWDASNILLGQQRTISCDASSESSNRNSNCSSDDNCPSTPGAGSSIISNANTHNSTDKDHQEVCGSSSDYSNSEDEMSTIEDNSAPRAKSIFRHWVYDGGSTTSRSAQTSTATMSRNSKPNSIFYVSVEQ